MVASIAVIGVFGKNSVRPVKFKYAGRTHWVERILYSWATRQGSYPVHHFSVLTRGGDRFEISLNTYAMNWSINETDLTPPEEASNEQ